MVELVLRGEGLDPSTTPGTLRESIEQLIDDWLFDPNGYGARSGLSAFGVVELNGRSA
jgi:hypothetical protein